MPLPRTFVGFSSTRIRYYRMMCAWKANENIDFNFADIVLGEGHLRRVLTAYLTYYHGARTHLALEKDAPTTRRVQTPTEGPVVAVPEVGGLHHRYERRAA